MLTASTRFAATIAASNVAAVRVESWLGGRQLAANVPITSGTWEEDAGSRVPERLTIEVPLSQQWLPTTTTHPLAPYGQRLRVSRGVYLTDTGDVEFVPLGWVRIQSYEIQAKTVTVEALGLTALLDEARFIDPVQTSGTFLTAARGIAYNFPVVATVADRSMPARAWEDNRLDAIYELADTWPATCRVDISGNLAFTPPINDLTDQPVRTFTDGVYGTLISALPSVGRDGVYNAVRARGEESGDAPPVSATAYDTDPNSPTWWFGNYGQVPLYYSSPLLTTQAAAQAAANTRLANVRRLITAFTITAAIDPRVQVRDVVRVASRTINGLARIDKRSIPLPPGGGPMTLNAHLLPGRT